MAIEQMLEILKDIIRAINDQMPDDKVERFAHLIMKVFERYENKNI